MNTFEINEWNEVVPYTNGRRCTDTRAWREATELELQQQEEIQLLNKEVEQLKDKLENSKDKIKELEQELKDIEDNFKKGVYL